MIMFTNMVSGYLDPSVMTYAIQAIAGVVIAIGAVAGIYWRKAKKKVSDKLGIDENKNKEVEGDDIIIQSLKISNCMFYNLESKSPECNTLDFLINYYCIL